MRSTTRSLFLLLACVICFCAAQSLLRPALAWPTINAQTDETALRVLVEKLYAAYAHKDAEAYFRAWSTQAPSRAEQQKNLQRFWASVEKIEINQLTIASLLRDQSKARLRINLAIQLTKQGKAETQRQQRLLECVIEEDGWKVWREESAEEELAAALAQAKNEDERAALLQAQPELLNSELAQALLAQGRRLSALAQYSQALQCFRLAERVAEKCGDRKTVGQALNNQGVLLNRQGDYGAALLCLEKSLALKDADDKAGRAASLSNLGTLYLEQGDYERAREYLNQSLALREATADRHAQARVLGNLGNVYFQQGNYRLALEFYQRALQLRDPAEHAWTSGNLNNIGNIYRFQGDYELALDYYQQALAQAEAAKSAFFQAMILNNSGAAYFLQGKYEQAEAFFQKSLALRAAEDREGLATVFNNLGAIYQARRDYARAQEAYQRSLQLRAVLNVPRFSAESHLNLAVIKHKQGLQHEALELVERAVQFARQSNNPDMIWNSQLNAGQIYRALNRPAQARAAFESAINTIEALREHVAGDASEQARFFEDKLGPYHQMIEQSLAQQQVAAALAYAERAKARVLLDVLRSGHANITKAMSAAEQAEERRLQTELVSLNTQLYRERLNTVPDAARLAELEARLQRARAAQEAFQHTLYAAHPALPVQRGQTPPFDLPQVAATLLDAQTALLEYVVKEDKTFLFVITTGAARGASPLLKSYETVIEREELKKGVESFRRQLANRELTFRPTATRLYDLLLKPAAAQLQGKTKLVIVRDASLWELPFQALQTPANRYLLEDFAISYAPSLAALAEMVKLQRGRKREAAAPTLLALGNPNFGEMRDAGAGAKRSAARLVALPSAEAEVTRLATLYGARQSKIYVGVAAREERFKAEAGQSDILHLATHGMLNNVNPLYSQIVLAQPVEAGREDGLLEAWEVLKLNLRAELVVLSACETGRGRVGAGEGLIGLTWAFFVAGAPATVVSQWKVDATSTTELMLEFHRRWRVRSAQAAPLTKAEAWRAAALKLLRNPQYRHPFFWASFSLVGEAG